MGIAGGEKAMRLRKVGVVLYCHKQLRQGIVEASGEKERNAEGTENLAEPAARAEAQRSLEALDCQFGPAGYIPENTADIPATGIARIERERPVTSAIMASMSSPK